MRMDSGIYRHNLVVAPQAIDGNGHVNNVEYLRWMQDAALGHSDSLGLTSATLAAGGRWVIRSHRIEYLRPAFAGEEVSVLTWISNVRRVQSLRKYRIIHSVSQAVLAEAETDWIFTDAQTGRLRSIPGAVASLFTPVPQGEEPK
ncbi:MAG: acyl-CoA thioesterase [Thermodesulfobacteriota bacterium]